MVEGRLALGTACLRDVRHGIRTSEVERETTARTRDRSA